MSVIRPRPEFTPIADRPPAETTRKNHRQGARACLAPTWPDSPIQFRRPTAERRTAEAIPLSRPPFATVNRYSVPPLWHHPEGSRRRFAGHQGTQGPQVADFADHVRDLHSGSPADPIHRSESAPTDRPTRRPIDPESRNASDDPCCSETDGSPIDGQVADRPIVTSSGATPCGRSRAASLKTALRDETAGGGPTASDSSRVVRGRRRRGTVRYGR
jgi:hypothetical protein